ncbi:hypothetical protein KIN20_025153 [Parelaphostrongylus tenuis]|uniref:Uncharacterized protein n=1 Tax=Parelaphostrongylus tenuis TaxID=148309 RepID=A0AAD5N8G9_PARTN|nr:hypothetical protein KIN20_025153 [Parelaphostrongylus tenuis]
MANLAAKCLCVKSIETDIGRERSFDGLNAQGLTSAEACRCQSVEYYKDQSCEADFKESEGIKNQLRKGHPTTMSTSENIRKIRCEVQGNSALSMRRMAKKLRSSEWRVENIVESKLKLGDRRIAQVHDNARLHVANPIKNVLKELKAKSKNLTNMTKLLVDSLVISVIIITAVFGCGVLPPGQASTRNFTVTGFTLPVNMAYSADINVRTMVSGIASSGEAVQTFVSRLLMQTVFDVLEWQGRNAGLPDALIAAILGQLTVETTYKALECKKATVDHPNPAMECEFQLLTRLQQHTQLINAPKIII